MSEQELPTELNDVRAEFLLNDLGEVCAGREADDPSCELLPDGRCRQYHFVRLPLLPAQPPGR